jgi:hypothetical protein
LADECFGFGELGAGQPNRTGVELLSRDSRGFVRLGVRSKSNTRRHGEGRHARDVALEQVEIAKKCRCRDAAD